MVAPGPGEGGQSEEVRNPKCLHAAERHEEMSKHVHVHKQHGRRPSERYIRAQTGGEASAETRRAIDQHDRPHRERHIGQTSITRPDALDDEHHSENPGNDQTQKGRSNETGTD